MQSIKFDQSIRAVEGLLKKVSLLEGTVYNFSLPRSAAFNEISLASQDYNEVYEAGLRLSHYNFLLTDLAYFQFSRATDTEWALAYYPNPRITGSPSAKETFQELIEARDNGEISEEDFAELASDIPSKVYVPRFRFEYSQKQFKPVRHPGAHFHIGMSGEDRWSSARRLSPLSFAHLMLKYFYPDEWWPESRFSGPEENWKDPVHMANCLDDGLSRSLRSDGLSHLFCDEERSGLHFSST
ncbi:DUF2290 domain-containing protein [Falsirhodobacter sp. alg1]|uniref:DUF2290 domain-containing protein n=1 Tax=Falsirhodobacter sp. alg1 TaxID=1472418 RepID=UPI0009EA0DDD|nr:DUF2290 domain-containing protein [Falsirhodobacter sp. alg1]